uniref:Major facilitator superfamily (MFS) profile domain-containing protein n=1 Tax=Octactis speculum TaxID=3111310 RepID=A0A7S2ARN1_9STRA
MATGFLLQAALALIMAAILNLMGSNEKLLYGLYCSLIFSLNYGPNVATFVLPAEVFPAEVRTTLNGWASACGKLGALVGAFGLDVLLDMSNLTLILCLCAVLCLAGWCLTVVCLPASSSENFTCDRSKYHPPKRTAQLPPLHTVEESVSDRDDPQDDGDSGALITHFRDTTRF